MPSLKVKVNPNAKSAFGTYDGPEVPAGSGYDGVIKNVKVKESQEGNLYLNVLVEHKSTDKNRAVYNGAPQWIRVMFGDHEETQARLGAFMKAVTGKADTEVNIVDENEEARKGTGSLVKSIAGVNPAGKPVKFDVRSRPAQNGYAASTEGDFIRRSLEAPVAAVDEIDEADIEVDEEEGEEQSREEREAELKKEALADLRAAAKANEIDIKGLKKAEIIEAILDWEFEDVADDEEEDEEEDEEVEEEEVDEDEEEEEDEDPEGELRAELAGLDRIALKARLKEADSEAKVFKTTTDDDLREKIVSAELGEPPF